MPGLFNRLKIWSAGEVLKYSDLNGEFDNILANMESDNVAGWSSSVAQMQIQTNPGSVGTESLASNISGELERIRFAIARIIGKTYWYEAPNFSLVSLGGKSKMGFFYNGQSKQEAVYQLRRNLGNPVSGIGNLLTSAGKFSSFAFENTSASPNYIVGHENQLRSDAATLSLWYKSIQVGDGVLYNPLIGAYFYVNPSGKFQLDFQTSTSNGASDGKVVESVVGTTSVAANPNYSNAIVKYSVNGAAGVGTDSASIYVNGSIEGTPISSGTVPINVSNNSGSWLFLGKKPTITYSKFSAMGVTPNSESVNPWTTTALGTNSGTVSGGVLTISAASGSNYRYYEHGSFPASVGSGVLIQMKLRVRKSGIFPYSTSLSAAGGFCLGFRFQTNGIGAYIDFGRYGMSCYGSNSLNPDLSTYNGRFFGHDFGEWSHVALQCVPIGAGYGCNVFINGKSVGTFQIYADATPNSKIWFGKTASDLPEILADVEYIGWASTSSNPFVGNSSALQQYISDIACLDDSVSDAALIQSLSSATPEALVPIKRDCISKPIEYKRSPKTTEATIAANGTWKDYPISGTAAPAVTFYSDGITPTIIDANCWVTNVNLGAGVLELRLLIITSEDFSSYGITGHPVGDSLLTGETITFEDHGFCTASMSGQKLVVHQSKVFPAGKVEIYPEISSLGGYGAGTIQAHPNKLKITVYQGG